jgi:DNA invertase Pin-like site-specific DNA recombinase
MRRAVSCGEIEQVPDDVELVAIETGGVSAALSRIAAGDADTLIVGPLRDAATSLPALISLLDWLREAQADLIAIDVGLDTATRTGRQNVALLREIESWDRERDQPRGRPGLAKTAPHVAERIAELYARGLGPKAIAAALNAEGVPTPRGGAQWRASSVQSALGYRRPRPPAPGAPKPPKPRPPAPGAPKPPKPPKPRPAGPHPPPPERR